MNEKLKTIKIIHFAICAGVIIAYIVLLDWNTIQMFKLPEIDQNSIKYLFVPIAAYFLSNYLFKKQIKSGEVKPEFKDNIALYQTASVSRWAILEGAAFIILILNKEFILFGIFIIVYLISLHPTEARIKRELNLR